MKLFRFSFLLILLVNLSLANTRRVPSEYPDIQSGIDAAFNGDTVLVADGVFTGSGNRNIDFDGNHITVISENGPDYCIVDLEHSGRGFLFENNESSTSRLIGFSIINGENNEPGIGIYIEGASPVISNCVIAGNVATGNNGEGAGIFCDGANPQIFGCIISENYAFNDGGGIALKNDANPQIENCTISNNNSEGLGGGIYCYYSDPVIVSCAITGNYSFDSGGGICGTHFDGHITDSKINYNHSLYRGGGIYFSSFSDPVIERSEICGNMADDRGGGVYAGSNSSDVINCTICDNLAGEGGGGVYCVNTNSDFVNVIIAHNFGNRGVWIYDTFNVDFDYCLFYDNTVGNFGGDPIYFPSGIEEFTAVNFNGDSCDVYHNVYDDPAFIDHYSGNYQLLSSSICIDAGNPQSPDDPDGTRSDIGVYFYDHNLNPPVIEELTITAEGTDVSLHWSPFTIASSYNIYRSSEPCFDISVLTPFATVTDQVYTDENALTEGPFFYVVTTVIE